MISWMLFGKRANSIWFVLNGVFDDFVRRNTGTIMGV